MDITATDTGVVDGKDDIMGVLKLRMRSLLKRDIKGLGKDEREILLAGWRAS